MMGPIWRRWKILIVLYYVMMHLSIFTRHFRRGFSVFSGLFFAGKAAGSSRFSAVFLLFLSPSPPARSFSCFFCMNFMFPLDKPLFRVYNRSAWENTPTGYIKPLRPSLPLVGARRFHADASLCEGNTVASPKNASRQKAPSARYAPAKMPHDRHKPSASAAQYT